MKRRTALGNFFNQLFSGFADITWQAVVMWIIGGVLIFLAIKKKMEPTLLLPMGLGAILVNLPLASEGIVSEHGSITTLFNAGIANELFPLLLFIGIGAMIDFGPLLSNPKLMIFGAAAQFGIFFTMSLAALLGFELNDAGSIAIIGAADGPTAIAVSQSLASRYQGAIMVAAYSYMALVPIIQPPVIKLCTTKKERLIRMPYKPASVSKLTRILFPIVVTIIVGILHLRARSLSDSLCLVTLSVSAEFLTIFPRPRRMPSQILSLFSLEFLFPQDLPQRSS